MHIDPRYLANIELSGAIPSVPVVMQLIRICKLPAERYFNPGVLRAETEQRQRANHKRYVRCLSHLADGSKHIESLGFIVIRN